MTRSQQNAQNKNIMVIAFNVNNHVKISLFLSPLPLPFFRERHAMQTASLGGIYRQGLLSILPLYSLSFFLSLLLFLFLTSLLMDKKQKQK